MKAILWVLASAPLGSLIALLIEAASAPFVRAADPIGAIHERLAAGEDLLTGLPEGGAPLFGARAAVRRLATVGTSGARRMLRRSLYDAARKEQAGALIALGGRLVDLASNLAEFPVPTTERRRLRALARDLAEIRTALAGSAIPPPPVHGPPSTGHPLLDQMQRCVSLMRDVLRGALSPAAIAQPPETRLRNAIFFPDAFSNPDHLKFAIRGSLAAWLCYVIYNALFWPGISTAVVTCALTALTTVGASHQKQLLRVAGVLAGGVALGMGAQVFLLPSVDSIGGFTVLFIVVTAVAAWFATSSARLSYFGIQLGLGFYLVNLQEFKFQTSLVIARDRVVGVLLGLAMMWVTFDLFWSSPAGVQMKKAFVASLRSLAQLAREPVSPDRRTAIARIYALRAGINRQFDQVRSLADGVLFEFGSKRQRDLALRDCIRRWLPSLRTLFLMRIGSLQYRLQAPGLELPDSLQLWHRRYDDHSAAALDAMAGWINGTAAPGDSAKPIAWPRWDGPQPHNVASFAALMQGIDSLTNFLGEEIAATCPPVRDQPPQALPDPIA